MFEQVWGGAVLLVGGVKYERLRAVAGLVGYGESEVKRALMATAYTGNIEAVKQHLVASMDMNVTDTGFFRMTPLHYALFSVTRRSPFERSPFEKPGCSR